MEQRIYLTKNDLSERWRASERTIDRLRQAGTLPWVDLAGGKGSKPIVRFSIKDIENYENKFRLSTDLARGGIP